MKHDRMLYTIGPHGVQESTWLEKDWNALTEPERMELLAEHYEARKTLYAAQKREW
jgi:hypothetical protein